MTEYFNSIDPTIAALGVGALLLVMGRKLFWVAVIVVGFIAGWEFSNSFLEIQSGWLKLGISVLCGIAGGLLAMSYTTRFTPGTSLMIRLLIRASTS